MKHLLSVADLGADGLNEIMALAQTFIPSDGSAIPKSPTLAGKTVVSLFYEDSTRTRMSFEAAARKLGADVMTFSAGTSSAKKGESIRDTVQTIDAMGVNAFVVRHKSPGVPHQITQWTNSSVLNAGDGAHQHPTQALIDCITLRQQLGRKDLKGVRIAVVGDIAHSRVAHSDVQAFAMLGAEVTVVAPKTMLPSLDGWNCQVAYAIDDVLMKSDVIYTLRVQKERITDALFPSMDEYVRQFGLTNERYARLDEHVLVMDPGPVVRGEQMTAEVADSPRSLITKQVANGIPIRMAVLQLTLGAQNG